MAPGDEVISPSVLILNQNYEPLNICNARRAVVLLDRGKAEVLEHGEGIIRSPSITFSLPSVIRLVYFIKRPRPMRRLARREVFARDRYTCQYCGKQTKDLTIDHVIPRHRGGKHAWENLITACMDCNRRKAGRTLEEARMKPLREPKAPRTSAYYTIFEHLLARYEWRKFIPEWELERVIS